MTNDDRPVLVVTNLDDPTADFVIAELHDRGVPVVRFDAGDFPATLPCSAFIGDTDGWQGSLQTPSRRVELGSVRSMYYRRPSGFAFPHLDKQDERFAVAQARWQSQDSGVVRLFGLQVSGWAVRSALVRR